ncbi:hypothetical protein LRS05_07155 [Flavobacterium sp. J372]|uniref:hypothetical protein n=1 Tax=Flavobacterium sp. J372 TaxID=2898436 RepID=UPI0021513CFF|nr:hypothetical protein [Flavobacterium sp. J372]MCR5861926.1 hypothetical protein [Flavobacterium sp. J372]
MKIRRYIVLVCLLFAVHVSGQDVALYEQFNGRYDFTFVGNTLNKTYNGIGVPCEINTSSSALLSLPAGNTIQKAYLYWAGSGEGDFSVTLNGQNVAASRQFPRMVTGLNSNNEPVQRPFFVHLQMLLKLFRQAVMGSIH